MNHELCQGIWWNNYKDIEHDSCQCNIFHQVSWTFTVMFKHSSLQILPLEHRAGSDCHLIVRDVLHCSFVPTALLYLARCFRSKPVFRSSNYLYVKLFLSEVKWKKFWTFSNSCWRCNRMSYIFFWQLYMDENVVSSVFAMLHVSVKKMWAYSEYSLSPFFSSVF